jgi:hypothetical protein
MMTRFYRIRTAVGQGISDEMETKANGNAVTQFNAGTPGAESNHTRPTSYHSFPSAKEVLFE